MGIDRFVRWDNRSPEGASTTEAKGHRCAILSAALLIILVVCCGCPLDPSPPDLRSCTRLDIQFVPSISAYYIGTSIAAEPGLLDPDEKRYLQSMDTITIEDQKRIRAFADIIRTGSYYGRANVALSAKSARIICYSGERALMSFEIVHGNMLFVDGRLFEYSVGLLAAGTMEPPQVEPFRRRGECAWNMQKLYTAGPLNPREASAYPEPDHWCDAIVHMWRNLYVVENWVKRRQFSDAGIREEFICPGVSERLSELGRTRDDKHANAPDEPEPPMISHYALNPSCEPNSPPDTVLLFETKAGWNQHGGPELFTFENHDPRGGLVLLNDSTVKFIRTEEELRQLRWR